MNLKKASSIKRLPKNEFENKYNKGASPQTPGI
jgi:hypothetical protein